jgi:putative transposase
VAGAWRSTLRSKRIEPGERVEQMKALAARLPRYGYRRLHVVMVRQGWKVNHKRFYRLYRREGLAVRKRKRRAWARVPLRAPVRINQAWSMDYTHDQLAGGRRFRTLNIVDERVRPLKWTPHCRERAWSECWNGSRGSAAIRNGSSPTTNRSSRTLDE